MSIFVNRFLFRPHELSGLMESCMCRHSLLWREKQTTAPTPPIQQKFSPNLHRLCEVLSSNFHFRQKYFKCQLILVMNVQQYDRYHFA